MKDFLELAAERYSCRKFSDKPVEEEKIQKILQAARLAPTAKNGQPSFHLSNFSGKRIAPSRSSAIVRGV